MKRFFPIAAMIMLAGCEVGPDYAPPPVDAPPAYKEASPAPGADSADWQKAKPLDAANRGDWWAVFNDPQLDALEKQIDISNQNIKGAEAAWRQARAVVEESRSELFPVVTLDASALRTGGPAAVKKGVTTYNLGAGASWVPDLWGAIRRQIESDIANAQATAAQLASARLAAQAELASDYFALHAQDELVTLLNTAVEDDRKILQIVQNQYDQGIVAKADVLTAQTQLESVQAQAVNAGIARAQYEHAIAVLTGKPPAEVTIASAPLAQAIPQVPAEIPSVLLERRPDIATAERQMAAANAQIGVAVSAWFPNLTLSASYGFASTALGKLMQAPSGLWSFGPALAETVFDAGLREAQVEAARAAYDQTVATYRQAVLTGFQQVEDELAAQRILAEQTIVEDQVVADAKTAEELTLNQYKEGTVPYSSVLTAQTVTLSNEQAALTVRANRFAASVALIEALGGGWDVSQLANDTLPDDSADKTDADKKDQPTP